MPNWVINELTCDQPHVLSQLRDFNRIIPMPLILEKTVSGSHSHHFEQLVDEKMTYCEMLQRPPAYLRKDENGNKVYVTGEADKAAWPSLLRRYYLGLKLYGHPTWYDWCLYHWGCKWNAKDFEINESGTRCRFETPWSHPMPLVEALSRTYPQALIEVQFADETIGYNAGRYTIKDGEYLVPDDIVCGSREAYEIAFDLWGGREEYRYDEEEGSYVYIDED